MAVFSGGRTLDAIETVCDAGGDLPLDAFEGVSSLLDKSLLRQEEGPEGEPRFVMLETIHEYARERLQDSGEAEEIGRAHIRGSASRAAGSDAPWRELPCQRERGDDRTRYSLEHLPRTTDETRDGRITGYLHVPIILTRSAVHKALASYFRSYQPSAVGIQPRQS